MHASIKICTHQKICPSAYNVLTLIVLLLLTCFYCEDCFYWNEAMVPTRSYPNCKYQYICYMIICMVITKPL